MKRHFRIIIVLLLIVLTAFSSAFGITAAESSLASTGKTLVEYEDWMIEKIDNDSFWTLDTYIGSGGDVAVPRNIDGLYVVKISNHCFANNTTVTSVMTSSPLWIVGDYAFTDCASLESFECNYAMKAIGVGAFSGTKSLKSINIQESVITQVSDYTFANSGLTEINLPLTVASIGNYAFMNDADLMKAFIPASVTEIADTAFDGCEDLTIYCYADSYAQTYAREKGIPYVLIEEQEPTEEPTEAPTEAHTFTFVLGDADGDGHANIIDATFAQRIATGLRADPDGSWTIRSDVDRSGAVEVTDATFIQRFDVGLVVPYQIGQQITIEMYF